MTPRSAQPSILFGVTSDQTLLVLTPRILALRRAGFVVAVFSSPGPHLDRLASIAAENDLTIHPISIRRGIAPLHDFVAFVRILMLLARLRPTMVDCSTPKAALLGLLAARLLRTPVRVHTLRGLRLESEQPIFRRCLLTAERLTSACAHYVLCNSPSLRDEAASLALAPVTKLRLLAHGSSNGVDLDRFHPGPTHLRADFDIPDEALVLGFVGRITCHKGIPELLDAFDQIHALLPHTWLLLVGWFDRSQDSLDPSQIARIERHPHIAITGFVADVAACYRAMDIFVLPTHREGFPNAALEAAATALPVITTHATGARDAVRDGVTGLLVSVGDLAALTQATLLLLHDSALRQRMGAAARLWVQQNFSQQQVLDATAAFFQQIAPIQSH